MPECLLPKEIEAALDAVLQDNWADEFDDYRFCTDLRSSCSRTIGCTDAPEHPPTWCGASDEEEDAE